MTSLSPPPRSSQTPAGCPAGAAPASLPQRNRILTVCTSDPACRSGSCSWPGRLEKCTNCLYSNLHRSLLRQEYYPISPFLELHQSDKVHLNWNKPQSNIVCAGLGISIVQIICQLQFENISTTLWILRNVRVWAVRGPGVIKASNMPAMIRTIRILLFLTISGIREGEREKHFYQLRYL